MSNTSQTKLLLDSVYEWNRWRQNNPDVVPDLTNADLHCRVLDKADLHKAQLQGANLTHAFFHDADFCCANLTAATLEGANFCRAHLRRANLTNANLRRANLDSADISGADLTGANLELAILVGARVTGTDFTGCHVYGISAWNLNLQDATSQADLRITTEAEPDIRVGNLEVAQFVYLMLHNSKIREVLDTIAQTGVLILGRFSPDRKRVLDRIREKLQELKFVPMMFDFERPDNPDLLSTVRTLAGLSRFIIADITDPKSVPAELQAIVPDYTIPLAPIFEKGADIYAVFPSLQRHRSWVLDPYEYTSADQLIVDLETEIVDIAVKRSAELLTPALDQIRIRRGRGVAAVHAL